MNATKTELTATKLDFLKPDFEPLRSLLGHEALLCDFMWMQRLTLSDGTILHSYKHSDTRRYIHVTPDKETYCCHSPGETADLVYKPISRTSSISHAFDGSAACSDERLVAIEALLARYRALKYETPVIRASS